MPLATTAPGPQTRPPDAESRWAQGEQWRSVPVHAEASVAQTSVWPPTAQQTPEVQSSAQLQPAPVAHFIEQTPPQSEPPSGGYFIPLAQLLVQTFALQTPEMQSPAPPHDAPAPHAPHGPPQSAPPSP
jgi:hypothetical protein